MNNTRQNNFIRLNYFSFFLQKLLLCILLNPLIANANTPISYFSCDTVATIQFNTSKVLEPNNIYLYENSKDTLQSLLCYAQRTNNLQLEALSLYKLADEASEILRKESDLKYILTYLEQSIAISEKHHFWESLLAAKEKYCTIFTSNRLYSQAIPYAQDFIETAKSIRDSSRIAEGYMLLGRIVREQGDYIEADSILRLSLQYQSVTTSQRVQAYTYLHLSHLKRLEKDYELSLKYAKKGIEHAKKAAFHSVNLNAILSIEIILNNIEVGIFDNDKWFALIEKGIPLSPWVQVQYLLIKGIHYDKKEEDQTAIEYYNNALKTSEQENTYLFTIQVIKHLMNHHQQLPKEILSDLYTKNQIAHEKLALQGNQDNLFASTYYKLESEQNRADFLQYRLDNSNKILLFTIGLIALLLIIAILIYRQSGLNKQYYQATEALNKELQTTVNALHDKTQKLNQSNNQLEKILIRREKIIERLKKFTAVFTHDLKQPIRTISLFGQLLKKTVSNKLEMDEQEYLDAMINSSSRLDKMVKTLYQYSNNTLAALNNFKLLQPNEIIENVKQDLFATIKETNATITVAPLHTIIGEEVLIYQLFQNLLANALKYHQQGISPIITITNEIKQDTLIIAIKDNGIGIKEEPNLDIFKLFHREDAVTDKEGYGLGLATCKEIIEIHGGDIWYTSEIGEGTTFYVSFKDFNA